MKLIREGVIHTEKRRVWESLRVLFFFVQRYSVSVVLCALVVIVSAYLYLFRMGPQEPVWTLLAIGLYALGSHAWLSDPRLMTSPIFTVQVAWRVIMSALASWLVAWLCHSFWSWEWGAALVGSLIYSGLVSFVLYCDFTLYPAAQAQRPKVSGERGQPTSGFAPLRRLNRLQRVWDEGPGRLLKSFLPQRLPRQRPGSGSKTGRSASGASTAGRRYATRGVPVQQPPRQAGTPPPPLRPPLPRQPFRAKMENGAPNGVHKGGDLTGATHTPTVDNTINDNGSSVNPGGPSVKASVKPSGNMPQSGSASLAGKSPSSKGRSPSKRKGVTGVRPARSPFDDI